MSDISENLHLYYLQGSDPRDYRLSLIIGESSSPIFAVEQFSQLLGEEETSGLQYNVNVQLNAIPQGYSELSVLLGPLDLPISNVWFNLYITDSNSNQIAYGHIRVEEGEQETRPLEEG